MLCMKPAIHALIMHSGTVRPQHQISRSESESESESHHVGVSHKAAQKVVLICCSPRMDIRTTLGPSRQRSSAKEVQTAMIPSSFVL